MKHCTDSDVDAETPRTNKMCAKQISDFQNPFYHRLQEEVELLSYVTTVRLRQFFIVIVILKYFKKLLIVGIVCLSD